MKTKLVLQISLLGLIGLLPQASASTIGLSDWCVGLNGNISTACNGAGSGGSNPGGGSINLSGFDQTLENGTNNLGSVLVTLAPGQNQSVEFYADYDLDYPTYGSFDDYATVGGSLPSGWSYSANSPDITNSGGPTGSVLFDQFANNALDDTNHVPTPGEPPTNCCDVAFALSISQLNVAPGGTGTVTFTVSTTAPTSGFYIEQTNQDFGDSIYLDATVNIQGGGTTTPEPSTFVLGLGLIGIVLGRKRLRVA